MKDLLDHWNPDRSPVEVTWLMPLIALVSLLALLFI